MVTRARAFWQRLARASPGEPEVNTDRYFSPNNVLPDHGSAKLFESVEVASRLSTWRRRVRRKRRSVSTSRRLDPVSRTGWFFIPLACMEGFVGSAIQLQFLDRMPRLPDGLGVVLVHILNPYGMVWLRRANENNVDLNRNFLSGVDTYGSAPEAYVRLDRFLNPPGVPCYDLFHLRAATLVARYGMSRLRQAVAGGQCEYPRGLFYGGKRLGPGPTEYQGYLAIQLAPAA